MYAIIRYPVRFAYKIWYNFKIEGAENVPLDRAVIFASNHRSYSDPVLLTMVPKLPVTYMAKEELFHNKFFGWLIKKLGAFPVKRNSGDFSVIDTASDIIKSGKNLVIFPEGTRSKDGTLGKGKTGVALIAAKTGADVVPCAIIFEGEKLRFRKKLTLRIGEVIKAEELAVSDESSPRELKAVKARIMSEIGKLM